MTRRFVLIQDDDCHWYVCPVDKQEEASEYFAKMANDDPLTVPDLPDWLEPVGGAPSLVEFDDYLIR